MLLNFGREVLTKTRKILFGLTVLVQCASVRMDLSVIGVDFNTQGNFLETVVIGKLLSTHQESCKL